MWSCYFQFCFPPFCELCAGGYELLCAPYCSKCFSRYLVLTNLREKYTPLSIVQHVEIRIDRLLKVTQPENGGVDSKSDAVNGGPMLYLL